MAIDSRSPLHFEAAISSLAARLVSRGQPVGESSTLRGQVDRVDPVGAQFSGASSALPDSLFPRLSLFEFNESPWFPACLRNGITEILRVLDVQLRVHEVIRPVLEQAIDESGTSRIVDLCSGAGGPVLAIEQQLAASGREVSVLLTDMFPNRAALRLAEENSGGRVRGLDSPVDATRVPRTLTGLRTLFNAFHHFDPIQARGILADAFHSRQPIAIFETTERSLLNTSSNFFLSFLATLALMPRMRSKRSEWWIFTYLAPILPAAFGWDALVSCLRSYTAREFDALTQGLSDQSYTWKSGRKRVPGSHVHINYFVGMPVKIHQTARVVA